MWITVCLYFLVVYSPPFHICLRVFIWLVFYDVTRYAGFIGSGQFCVSLARFRFTFSWILVEF